jgi:hypothetical protein
MKEVERTLQAVLADVCEQRVALEAAVEKIYSGPDLREAASSCVGRTWCIDLVGTFAFSETNARHLLASRARVAGASSLFGILVAAVLSILQSASDGVAVCAFQDRIALPCHIEAAVHDAHLRACDNAERTGLALWPGAPRARSRAGRCPTSATSVPVTCGAASASRGGRSPEPAFNAKQAPSAIEPKRRARTLGCKAREGVRKGFVISQRSSLGSTTTFKSVCKCNALMIHDPDISAGVASKIRVFLHSTP